MKPGRSKDVVAACALLSALALGAWLLVRSNGLLGSSWTDGARRFASETGEVVRHAVWDAPEPLGALGEGADPTLSPDGRWLFFAVGERGLNAELYVAELAADGARDPQPLALLNTAADELAPAFGPGGLYFASDRPGGQGGLDLWRASYADGVFGPAEPLGPGLNSPAEETDPASLPGSRALLFASDRPRRTRGDFDLYSAAPDEDGFYAAEPLDLLNTPADEREPAVASDGRSLYFASDRAGGPGSTGSFDLYRSLRPARDWQAPALVRELSSARSERGPWPSADGFALLFDAAGPGGRRELLRALSLELFRAPPPAVSLAEWLTLAALLLLALLALLAKRWRALDILYKCLLVSLLLHLLLMLYLRTVYPEAKSYDTGTGEGPTFRVRLAPEEQGPRTPAELQASRGLAAPLAPARGRFEPSSAPAAAPALAELAVPEREAESAPARATAELSPAPLDAGATELVEREAPSERYAGRSPELALAMPAAAERPPSPASEAAASSPARARQGSVTELGEVAPAAAHFERIEAAPGELARGAPARPELARGASQARETALAAPEESFERSAGAAPGLELTARASERPRDPRETSGGASVERERFAPADGAPAQPVQGAGRLPPAPGAAAESTGGAPARERLEVASATGSTGIDAELRAPGESAAAALSDSSPAFDATAGLASKTASPPAPGASLEGPVRGASAPASRPESSAGAARPSGPAALEAPEVAGVTAAAPRPAPSGPPDAGGVASAPPELRAPAGAPAPAPASASSPAPFDAIAGLSATMPRERELDRAAPERARIAADEAMGPARPAARPLAPSVPAAAAPAPADQAPPPRLSATPYQNRFGEQKLRALEEFGGSVETERAVAAGLAYLARIQGEGGAWGQRSDAHQKYLDVRIGKTALALLAFLGAGHVPAGDTEHAGVAERAVRFLLSQQDGATGHLGRSCSYGHGIATYALAECYALTRAEHLRAPLERALEEILRHQSRDPDPRFAGGWGYYFADGHVWNEDEWPRTSVTAWQVMALESARLGGLAVPAPAFKEAREFLLNAWDGRARAFRYDHDPARLSSGYPILPASTPAALFALSLLGVDPARPELAQARRFVLARQPDGYRYTGDDDFVRHARGNLYFWYYATLALFRVGGIEWERWNTALKETLLPAQDEDGSWRPLDAYAEYAGDEDDERTYTTAMCVLSLEIYYRYFTPLLRVR